MNFLKGLVLGKGGREFNRALVDQDENVQKFAKNSEEKDLLVEEQQEISRRLHSAHRK